MNTKKSNDDSIRQGKDAQKTDRTIVKMALLVVTIIIILVLIVIYAVFVRF